MVLGEKSNFQSTPRSVLICPNSLSLFPYRTTEISRKFILPAQYKREKGYKLRIHLEDIHTKSICIEQCIDTNVGKKVKLLNLGAKFSGKRKWADRLDKLFPMSHIYVKDVSRREGGSGLNK